MDKQTPAQMAKALRLAGMTERLAQVAQLFKDKERTQLC